MKFRIYDILSHLIPGLIIYYSLVYLYDIPQLSQAALYEIAMSMITGFIINALASWLEPLYFWLWGGNPNKRLLEGKDILKVRFSRKDIIADKIKEKYVKYEDYNSLFQCAYQEVTNSPGNSRIQTFNENYAYARSLLTTIIVLSVVCLSQYYLSWKIWIISAMLIMLLLKRTKERAYYFSREVLAAYLSINENKNKEFNK